MKHKAMIQTAATLFTNAQGPRRGDPKWHLAVGKVRCALQANLGSRVEVLGVVGRGSHTPHLRVRVPIDFNVLTRVDSEDPPTFIDGDLVFNIHPDRTEVGLVEQIERISRAVHRVRGLSDLAEFLMDEHQADPEVALQEVYTPKIIDRIKKAGS